MQGPVFRSALKVSQKVFPMAVPKSGLFSVIRFPFFSEPLRLLVQQCFGMQHIVPHCYLHVHEHVCCPIFVVSKIS